MHYVSTFCAVGILALAMVHGAMGMSPSQCNQLFEKGRYYDNTLNKASNTWLRSQERVFKRLEEMEGRLSALVAKGESPDTYAIAREESRRLSEFAGVIVEQGRAVYKAAEDVEEILSDLEIECGVPPNIADWHLEKTEIVVDLLDQAQSSESIWLSIQKEFEQWTASPSRLLARIDLLRDEVEDLTR